MSIFKTKQAELETVTVGYPDIGEIVLYDLGGFTVRESEFCREELTNISTPEQLTREFALTLSKTLKKKFELGDIIDKLNNLEEESEFSDLLTDKFPEPLQAWQSALENYRTQEQLVLSLAMLKVRAPLSAEDKTAALAEVKSWTTDSLLDPTVIHPTLIGYIYTFALLQFNQVKEFDYSALQKPQEDEVEEDVVDAVATFDEKGFEVNPLADENLDDELIA